MNIILNLKNFFFDQIKIPKNFFKNNENINFVDVGASNFKNLMFYFKYRFINLILFEPDTRAIESYLSKKNNLNLKIFDKGLWSKKEKKLFYQYLNQASSSFYKPNLKKLSQYNLGLKPYELKGTSFVEVESLDRIYKTKDVDFIKLDTEGADYEILLGAKKNLKNCLGLMIETQFFERYLNSKSFSEIEIFLRKNGYEIFIINIEKWSQHELYNINTNIKNVWADTLFFLSIENLIERLKKSNNKIFLIKKMIFLMMTYGLHDSSIRYLENIKKNKLISQNDFLEINKFIKMNIKSNSIIIISDLFRLSICIIFLPVILIYKRKYLELLKHFIEKNINNIKRLISYNLQNKSIFRSSGTDIH